MATAGSALALSTSAPAADPPAAKPTTVHFVDRTADSGITVENRCGADPRYFIPEGNGAGAAWLDYDGDGDLDLYVVNGNGLEFVKEDRSELRYVQDAANALYRNDGVWNFTDVTEAAGVGDRGWGNGVAVADVNEDGRPDLYVANLGADVLYLNAGDGTFVDATAKAGLGHAGWSTGAAFGDVDRDGDLDLYVPCYIEFDPMNPPAGGALQEYNGVMLGYGPEGENEGINPGAANVFYENNGAGHFIESTAAAGLTLDKNLCSYAALIVDGDGDGWADIFVTNDVQPNSFYRNQGDGTFEEVGDEHGFARGDDGKYQAGMGLALGDPNADGTPDFFVTNFDFEPNNLYLNQGDGQFADRAKSATLHETSVPKLGWGCTFLDADSDGALDLFVANGHVIRQCEEIGMSPWHMPNQLFLGAGVEYGAPRFTEYVPADDSPLARAESSRGVAAADADNDGDVDLVIVDLDGPPQVLENRTDGGEWIAFELIGTASPRDAYGARVTIRATNGTQTQWKVPNQGIYSSHDPRVRFGLGTATSVDEVEIAWTSGAITKLTNLDAGRVHSVTESESTAAQGTR